MRSADTDSCQAIVKLGAWFRSPAGQYVQQWEQRRLDAIVEDVFGFVAVQVGFHEYNALRKNRIPFRAYFGPVRPEAEQIAQWHGVGVADAAALPLASQSVELLVLPHVLEYAHDPHAVLRVAERVLLPEGRLVIVGFNPRSLWGARHRLGREGWLPQTGRFIALPRLKDWLKLLSFELDRGHFGCYALPLASSAALRRMAWLDKAGDRWWPVGGAVYIVSAIKRVHGMRLVGPAWKRKRAPARAQVAINRRPHAEGERSTLHSTIHDQP